MLANVYGRLSAAFGDHRAFKYTVNIFYVVSLGQSMKIVLKEGRGSQLKRALPSCDKMSKSLLFFEK